MWPILHKMLLNLKFNRDSKRVAIEFNGVVMDMRIGFSLFSRLIKLVGVAFTGAEWERLCQAEIFSSSKVLNISSDENADSFVGKCEFRSRVDGRMIDDVNVDMAEFKSHTDADVEWVGCKEKVVEENEVFHLEEVDHEDFDSGMEQRRQLWLKKNDKLRVRVVCRGEVPDFANNNMGTIVPLTCNPKDPTSKVQPKSISKKEKATKPKESYGCPWAMQNYIEEKVGPDLKLPWAQKHIAKGFAMLGTATRQNKLFDAQSEQSSKDSTLNFPHSEITK
ncbi:hypothetical protein Tco_0092276, partial [Tanacetum coccineum]